MFISMFPESYQFTDTHPACPSLIFLIVIALFINQLSRINITCMPFTAEEFLQVFSRYNIAVFPMQGLLYLLAFLIVYLVIRKSGKNRLIPWILSFFWLWMGAVYHILFFSELNKVAYIFGGLFILQGVLFYISGIIRKELYFEIKWDIYGITGAIFIFTALFIYPALGFFLGHVYPAAPTFGLPCPTTIFTFGILLWSKREISFSVAIIPFFWSLLGFSAAWNLGIQEDTLLLLTGIITMVLLLARRRASRPALS
jgi:hypothetical protein